MKQSDFKLKHKSTKTTGQPQQQKVCVSLRMSPVEREMILNRKTDRDLSNNIFLMRIIRKYFAEHREELMMGARASAKSSPSTSSTKLTPPLTTMEGKSS
jgi:hypothetical protein